MEAGLSVNDPWLVKTAPMPTWSWPLAWRVAAPWLMSVPPAMFNDEKLVVTPEATVVVPVPPTVPVAEKGPLMVSDP